MHGWSEATERKLLMCLIDHNAKPNWSNVATAMGDEFTGEACRCVMPYSLLVDFPVDLRSLLSIANFPAI